VSNLKQCGLGILQYSQDYDEDYPVGGFWAFDNTARACVTSIWPNLPKYSDANWVGDPMWMGFILPYTKTTAVYYCPSGPLASESPQPWWTGSNTSVPNNVDYGYAANIYVLPTAAWAVGTSIDASCNITNIPWAAPHTQMSQFGTPAQLCMLMDRGQEDRTSGIVISGFNPKGYTMVYGNDSLASATGHNPSTRHNGGAEFLFVDGHVKFLTYDQYTAAKPGIIDGNINY
jgi:prepilin-type processing-associated H-X9-DG protein